MLMKMLGALINEPLLNFIERDEHTPAALLRAKNVRRSNVMCDAVHPCSQRTLMREVRKTSPEREVHLLEKLLSNCGRLRMKKPNS